MAPLVQFLLFQQSHLQVVVEVVEHIKQTEQPVHLVVVDLEEELLHLVDQVLQEIHLLQLLPKDKMEEMDSVQQHNTKQVEVVELVQLVQMLVVELLVLVEQE